MNEIMTIQGIECYEKGGVAYLSLEAVARGLGFTQTARSGNEVVRWERVNGYLKELGFVPTSGDGYIPENIFYRLAMKAKNETAERFQALIADEVIPAIRKHGGYLTPEMTERVLSDPDTIIRLATDLKNERAKTQQLLAINSELTVQKQIMQPKADYFDELVDRNLLTSIRETAKQLHTKQKSFVGFLLDHKYLYRDKKGNLMPYAQHVDKGLFELKECFNEKSTWAGTQTMITPKGRETFRLLMVGVS